VEDNQTKSCLETIDKLGYTATSANARSPATNVPWRYYFDDCQMPEMDLPFNVQNWCQKEGPNAAKVNPLYNIDASARIGSAALAWATIT
jgi:hypothetical protein